MAIAIHPHADPRDHSTRPGLFCNFLFWFLAVAFDEEELCAELGVGLHVSSCWLGCWRGLGAGCWWKE
eukprot:scaffold94941_cov55-Attheya_sp.AAC.1